MLEFLRWPQCWFHEIEIFAMYSYIPLGLNQLLNVGVDQWLHIYIVETNQWVDPWACSEYVCMIHESLPLYIYSFVFQLRETLKSLLSALEALEQLREWWAVASLPMYFAIGGIMKYCWCFTDEISYGIWLNIWGFLFRCSLMLNCCTAIGFVTGTTILTVVNRMEIKDFLQ